VNVVDDVAPPRGSQAVHTQPICHNHAQGSKQPAKNSMGSGHVILTAKNTGGGRPPKRHVLGLGSRLAASLRSPDALTHAPATSYPCQSSQRQTPRFHRLNGARRSSNRRFVCGPATATKQPARLPRPPLPPTTPWRWPGSNVLELFV